MPFPHSILFAEPMSYTANLGRRSRGGVVNDFPNDAVTGKDLLCGPVLLPHEVVLSKGYLCGPVGDTTIEVLDLLLCSSVLTRTTLHLECLGVALVTTILTNVVFWKVEG